MKVGDWSTEEGALEFNGGGTRFAPAMELAKTMIEKFDNHQKTVFIVVTDGPSLMDQQDAEHMDTLKEDLESACVTVRALRKVLGEKLEMHTMSFGPWANKEYMHTLAEAGKGTQHHSKLGALGLALKHLAVQDPYTRLSCLPRQQP